MEWIGFIVLFLLGLWFGIMGLAVCFGAGMLGGKVGAEWLIPLAGAAIIYVAFKFAPFSVVIN